MSRTILSACAFDCPDSCGLAATVEGGRLLTFGAGRITPIPGGPSAPRDGAGSGTWRTRSAS